MRVSIVMPALDEARGIARILAPLQPLRTAGHEVIVVDGGSVDATVALAAPLADRVLVAPKGRGSQMNAGAATATGDVLLFLHADTWLPSGGVEMLAQAMASSRRRWGRFDVSIAGHSRLFPLIAAAMNARSRLTGIATGDQAIFVERALFRAVGGYPDQPLMEDIELSRRLKRADGPPICLRRRVVTSGRRWEQDGAWPTIVAMWRWRFEYWRGADPSGLAAEYDKVGQAAPMTLQIFAKAPVPGQVKTRLAQAIGEREAAAVHARFVEATLATAAAVRAAGIVDAIELWCAPDAGAPVFSAWRDRHGIALRTQDGADLGARMRCALDSALVCGSRAILIGTDCPVLDAAYLAQAVDALRSHDAVFGPVEDGGYVLVGLARSVDLFSGVPWSTAATMAATREQMRAAGVTWHELPMLWDVDEPADLVRWQSLAATSPQVPAPEVAA